MQCRDVDAGRLVRDEITAQLPRAMVDVIRCDLASFASVRESVDVIRRKFDRIGLLINNAGRVSARRRVSGDGFELTFASNYLGPFLLTRLLLDRMDETGRMINVASRVHYRGSLDLEQVTNPRARYNGVAAHSQSKLATVLHTFALARRLSGTQITANCLHPGIVATNLLPRWLRVVKPLISPLVFDAERGARTALHLALSDEVAGLSGRYFDENQVVQPAAKLTNDIALQDSLWAKSEQWVGSSG
jgi:NAD(P)-dependent dehydrogenase (short-subunit alcohol dehydrogenase family)